MNTNKNKLEAQNGNFAEKKVNKISSNLPVIKSVCCHDWRKEPAIPTKLN